MSKLWRRSLWGVALAVLVYGVFAVLGGVRESLEVLRLYEFRWLVFALLCSSANYALRFGKWELCLQRLQVRRDAPGLTYLASLAIYVAGLGMSISPGKLGEVVRSGFLRERYSLPVSRTAPIVLADRLTDVLALLTLSAAGVYSYPALWPAVAMAAVLVVCGLFGLSSQERMAGVVNGVSRMPGLGRLRGMGERFGQASEALFARSVLFKLWALGVMGWALEGVGYYCVLRGLPGISPSLLDCLFLWSVTTLVGAVSVLPGGIGATEGSLVWLSSRRIAGLVAPFAFTSTLLIRAATLWFGTIVGGVAMAALAWGSRKNTRSAGAKDAVDPTRAASVDLPKKEVRSDLS